MAVLCVMTIWCIVFKSISREIEGRIAIDKVVNLLVYTERWMANGARELQSPAAQCFPLKINLLLNLLGHTMKRKLLFSFPFLKKNHVRVENNHSFHFSSVFSGTVKGNKVEWHIVTIDLFDFLIFPRALSRGYKRWEQKLVSSSFKKAQLN
jgi:hypothetical protein